MKDIIKLMEDRLRELHDNFHIVEHNDSIQYMYKGEVYKEEEINTVLFEKLMEENDITALAFIYFYDRIDESTEHIAELFLLYFMDTELTYKEYKKISLKLLDIILQHVGIEEIKEKAVEYIMDDDRVNVKEYLSDISSEYLWSRYF